ncbi:phosphoglycerate dehydrogenase [Mesobacillus foraminis]|uniref:phosphoglycerate dehydrogenase n=1 Tax=Mesobacillus foraminis TaxID=279826 RepID=UPI001BE83425|nr:phosphoglycerate dehydrogenase [Mesobacillus foraminis]MBT2757849.1 phosphoglycerate dehydrogenase [Mesobacillus foraminis]
MYKVVSSSPTFGKYSNKPVTYLEKEHCTVTILEPGVADDEEKFAEELYDCDVLIVGVEKVTGKVLEGAKNLKVIAKHGAGVDNIDLLAAKERNIPVAFAPGANRHAVADLALGLMLSLARNIPSTHQKVSNGEWPRVVGTELFGKTLGVIGTGKIGKEVIRRAKGFSMNILALDPFPDSELMTSGVQYVSKETLISCSDFITIHTDLNEGSRNLFDQNAFQNMKKTSYLINTARGGIVDEEALYEALKVGEIAGAALDVFLREPAGTSHLLTLGNFIATPHMAGYTAEALEEVGLITARNIVNVLKGKRAEYEWMVRV